MLFFRTTSRQLFPSSWLLLLVVLASGCDSSGDKFVPVKGALLVNGQPYDPQTQEEVMMILYPATEEGGTSYPAVVKADGTFQVPGVDGKGVPAGKYRISLERMSDDRKTKVMVPRSLAGRETKLEREITKESGDLGTIDVTKVP